MKINIEHNVDGVSAVLQDLVAREMRYAARDALNETAYEVLDANKLHMQRVFDRPTPWTLNGFWIRKANGKTLTATFEQKRGQGRRFYLGVQRAGGYRPKTGVENRLTYGLAYGGVIHAVTPARGIRKNSYGNVSPKTLQRILSGIQAQRDTSQNTTASSRKRHRRRAQYFVPRPGSKLSKGVYERKGARQKIKKVLHFTNAKPLYERRYFPEKVAERVILKKFRTNYNQAFNRNLAKAVARRLR